MVPDHNVQALPCKTFKKGFEDFSLKSFVLTAFLAVLSVLTIIFFSGCSFTKEYSGKKWAIGNALIYGGTNFNLEPLPGSKNPLLFCRYDQIRLVLDENLDGAYVSPESFVSDRRSWGVANGEVLLYLNSKESYDAWDSLLREIKRNTEPREVYPPAVKDD